MLITRQGILDLGDGRTQGLDGITLAPEKTYLNNFT